MPELWNLYNQIRGETTNDPLVLYFNGEFFGLVLLLTPINSPFSRVWKVSAGAVSCFFFSGVCFVNATSVASLHGSAC